MNVEVVKVERRKGENLVVVIFFLSFMGCAT